MNHREDVQMQLEAALAELPMIDAHSHLVVSKLAARGLHDVLLYHMAVSDLYAAGCPTGARLTEYPQWPSADEAEARIVEAIPFLPAIRNTSTSWLVRTILADLYEWREPITTDNWRRLDRLIRERADDAAWAHRVLDRAGIDRVSTEYVRRDVTDQSGRFAYALEWAFFTRVQWGEFDTAVAELEQCWGQAPKSATPIGQGPRPVPEKVVRTVADVHAAMAHYVDAIPYDEIVAIATHFSTAIDYREVDDAEMEHALARRAEAGPAEREIYASYVNEAFLTQFERLGSRVLLQFSLGAEPLPYETGSQLSQTTVAQLGEMFARHPQIRFQCLLSSRHANQAICSLARELPNFSVMGYWWHNFFPDAMRQVMGERLDMLPVNRQVAFFSDAYCVEWAYAKSTMVRRQLAHVLAERVTQGQYGLDDAISIARSILWDAPRELNGIGPWERGESRAGQTR